jgi:hypothetical protein
MSIELNEQKPTVILTFKGDQVIKETKGFKGGKCIEATKFINDLLKPTKSEVKLTAEYHDEDFHRENDGLLA